MSSIVQKLQLIWTSNSAQARGDIGLASGNVLQLSRNVQQSGRSAGIASQQMRAFGTTLRYMVAGSVIYGMGTMVRNLAQLQQSMGLISAIGTTAGFRELSRTGGGIQQLTVDMLNMSTRTVTPMDEVSSAMANLVSSVQASQGIGTKDLVPALEIIGKAAKLSTTPVEDMTKGITSMNQAFGRTQSLSNIRHLAAQWYEMIALVPGGQSAAPQIIGQLGNLAQSSRFAHITPGQMFSLLSSQLRFGIPPSQAGMGLSYLARSIALPEAPGTVKSAREAFASMGITNKFVQSQGGLNTLVKIAQQVDKAGVHGNIKSAIGKAYAGRDDPNYDPNTVAGLGLTGEGVNLAGTIFRRQHALRSFIAFYALWKSGTFDEDLKKLGDSHRAYAKSLGDFAEGWKNFLAQVPLSQAATSLQNLTTELTMGFAPILKYPAQAITGVSEFAGRHPDQTRYAAVAAGSLVAALGAGAIASKIPGLKNIPGLGKFGGLFGKVTGAAGRGLVTTQAVQDAMRGLEDPLAPRGSTPTKPVYVYVIGQAPWVDSAKTVPTPKDITGGKELDALKKASKWAGLRMGTKALGMSVGLGLGAASVAALVLELGGDQGPMKKRRVEPHGANLLFGGKWTGSTLFARPGERPHLVDFKTNKDFYGRDAERVAAQRLHTTVRNVQKLEQRMSGGDLAKTLKDSNDKLVASIAQGAAGFTLNLTVVDEKGKITSKGKVHLPPETFVGGNHPGSRGRSKPLKIVGAMKNI